MSQFKQVVTRNLKSYSKSLAEIDQQNSLDLMLQLLEYHTINGYCSEEKIDKAITLAPDSQEYFHEAFTGLMILSQLYLRSPKGFVKPQELLDAVTDLKIRPEFINEITQKLIELKETSNAEIERPLRLTSPQSITWRINISRQITDEKNFMRRTIVLQITTKNGKIETVVIPIAMFHKLRFQVASALKSIQNLEGRASMKI
uniref:CSON011663 protein n=1 Tax=Culicoides sonorensis TaxID=179676 RepID=A0A336N0I0_CULSO